jgi:membrane dipeptidase
MSDISYKIDGMQYANWSEEIFRQMREGGVDAVHVTIAYHENFREMVFLNDSLI